MTNFQSQPDSSSFRWLTPERAVLVLPIAAGLVAAVALSSLVLAPLSLSLQQKRQQVAGLRTLRDELPLLKAQLLSSISQLQKHRQQQTSLLQLVAGVAELDTFLAKLNDLADRSGVILTKAVPGEVQNYTVPVEVVDTGESSPPPAAGGEGVEALDPLLREGLERRSAEIGVSGSFNQLLSFMRAVESLQVFVEISDLVLTQPSKSSSKDEVVTNPTLELALTLSAYGRQAEEPINAANIE